MNGTINQWDRTLLGAIAVAYAVGTPGFGVDTRTSAPEIVGALYTVAVLTPLVAVGASWKWPRVARGVAFASSLFAVTLPTLDLGGVLAGPQPAAMVALDVTIVALGLAVVRRSWLASRSGVETEHGRS